MFSVELPPDNPPVYKTETRTLELANLREALQNYVSTDRCEHPIRKQVLPTKYREEWLLYDCGFCRYCKAKAALANSWTEDGVKT